QDEKKNVGIGNLHGGGGFAEEVRDERSEVLHVGAEDCGFAEDSGFGRILSANFGDAGQALADEYGGGQRIPIAQFASSIDEQNVGAWRRAANVAAANDSQAERGEFVMEFSAPLDVARDDDQETIGSELPKFREYLRKKLLLGRPRAAGDNDGRVGANANVGDEFAKLSLAGGGGCRRIVELNATGTDDALAIRAESLPALDVFALRH